MSGNNKPTSDKNNTPPLIEPLQKRRNAIEGSDNNDSWDTDDSTDDSKNASSQPLTQEEMKKNVQQGFTQPLPPPLTRTASVKQGSEEFTKNKAILETEMKKRVKQKPVNAQNTKPVNSTAEAQPSENFNFKEKKEQLAGLFKLRTAAPVQDTSVPKDTSVPTTNPTPSQNSNPAAPPPPPPLPPLPPRMGTASSASQTSSDISNKEPKMSGTPKHTSTSEEQKMSTTARPVTPSTGPTSGPTSPRGSDASASSSTVVDKEAQVTLSPYTLNPEELKSFIATLSGSNKNAIWEKKEGEKDLTLKTSANAQNEINTIASKYETQKGKISELSNLKLSNSASIILPFSDQNKEVTVEIINETGTAYTTTRDARHAIRDFLTTAGDGLNEYCTKIKDSYDAFIKAKNMSNYSTNNKQYDNYMDKKDKAGNVRPEILKMRSDYHARLNVFEPAIIAVSSMNFCIDLIKGIEAALPGSSALKKSLGEMNASINAELTQYKNKARKTNETINLHESLLNFYTLLKIEKHISDREQKLNNPQKTSYNALKNDADRKIIETNTKIKETKAKIDALKLSIDSEKNKDTKAALKETKKTHENTIKECENALKLYEKEKKYIDDFLKYEKNYLGSIKLAFEKAKIQAIDNLEHVWKESNQHLSTPTTEVLDSITKSIVGEDTGNQAIFKKALLMATKGLGKTDLIERTGVASIEKAKKDAKKAGGAVG